ncbi:NAD(+) synthase [Romboutsia sp. 1001216sp1]|uniref:NAD(+) synthase n=1 Tax=unclassified Romboutsia TaxID=2626894 RepID=UPI00189EE02C|nr:MULTISPECIES: NAD(+) synthase [unclassified Romboutsia]MDB8789602.1 NAD(+) synthase [Romboutsia sp. 1001216sp1]MDB8793792.1 NAD(+) synthase [Romboutsia sp. 1001216sp1]MDB8797538.1 NAD(+) synthase [Romboutsia sp. 1001216sp1]MDB8799954.1 NAD(+) synthase [Romboutsia sp. 1001216sp1]MDB8802745.1 NAD(+) synthase [Romboutsia sp. 1001216sp1]
MKDIKLKIEKTVEWLREKVKEANSKGLIVGVSGGIDSAVVAYLIKKAFPENSMGVIMSIKSNPNDREDALKVINGCGIEFLDLDLTQPQDLILSTVINSLKEKNLYKEDYLKMTDANLRARVRMSTVYTVANNLGYLVVGTDNAAEIHTGYFTKYGDGGVDLVPLSNLTKKEVYEWAKVLGVHEDVINKAPSAGLWEGQTDENEMGTTYDMIDAVVEGRLDEVPQKDKEIIDRLHRVSEHKRHTPAGPPKF